MRRCAANQQAPGVVGHAVVIGARTGSHQMPRAWRGLPPRFHNQHPARRSAEGGQRVDLRWRQANGPNGERYAKGRVQQSRPQPALHRVRRPLQTPAIWARCSSERKGEGVHQNQRDGDRLHGSRFQMAHARRESGGAIAFVARPTCWRSGRLGQQLARAALNDAARVHDQNFVRVHHGGEAVRNEQRGLVLAALCSLAWMARRWRNPALVALPKMRDGWFLSSVRAWPRAAFHRPRA